MKKSGMLTLLAITEVLDMVVFVSFLSYYAKEDTSSKNDTNIITILNDKIIEARDYSNPILHFSLKLDLPLLK